MSHREDDAGVTIAILSEIADLLRSIDERMERMEQREDEDRAELRTLYAEANVRADRRMLMALSAPKGNEAQ